MSDKLKKGYIHVYTGDGKGKTTAAFGLMLRAVGAGMRVYIAQFLKGMEYSEILTLKDKFKDEVTFEQFGTTNYIIGDPLPEHYEVIDKGFRRVKEVLTCGEYDIIILDEINIALFFGLKTVDDLLEIMDLKPNDVELIMTGRKAPQEIIDRADLVTEMVPIKHYFEQGILSRKGIED
ncbi:MAG: cob(I)yrinic acid a,c-diamide adenosyltransferase [Planctomycetes bacterium]|nr:cob(I)yrinic acid a,c-diamide adenosyltransferase [Planctomycetota bacterium]